MDENSLNKFEEFEEIVNKKYKKKLTDDELIELAKTISELAGVIISFNKKHGNKKN